LETGEARPTTDPPQIPKRILRAFRIQDQVFGDTSQTHDFIYVSDAVDATIAVLERTPQSRVFIASRKQTAILELAKTMQRITQAQSELKFYPPRSGDIVEASLTITGRVQAPDFWSWSKRALAA
jgi:nucleoside-diphosphate-sugar epimerase